MPDPKPQPNDRLYFEILRGMTPQQRLDKALELSSLTKALFIEGLRRLHPTLPDASIRAKAMEFLYPWLKSTS